MHPNLETDEIRLEQLLLSVRPKSARQDSWAGIEGRLTAQARTEALHLDAEQKLEQALASLRPCHPSTTLRERVFGIFEASPVTAGDSKIITPSFRPLSNLLKVAAILLLSAGITSLLLRSPQQGSQSPSAIAPNTPNTPHEAMSAKALPSEQDWQEGGIVEKEGQRYRLMLRRAVDSYRVQTPDGQYINVEQPNEERRLVPFKTY